jgi:CHAT domain-containing protein
MRYSPYRSLTLLFVVLISSLALLRSQARAQSALQRVNPTTPPARGRSDVRALLPGESVEREIAGGEAHGYEVSLKEKEFLRVVVDQQGIDLVVTLYGPSKKKQLEVNLRGGDYGPEPVSYEVGERGTYQLDVRPFASVATRGRYRMVNETRPTATGQDRERLAAERLLLEARELELLLENEPMRKSIEKREQALVLWRRLSDRFWEAATLSSNGYSYIYLGENHKALEVFSQALSIHRAMRNRRGEALALSSIGDTYRFQGNVKKALVFYHQALPLIREVNYPRAEAGILHDLGKAYNSSGEVQRGLEYLNQALQLYKVVGDSVGQADCLYGLGYVYAEIGEMQKALELYQQSLSLCKGSSHSDLIQQDSVLEQIIMIYARLYNIPKALELSQRRLQLLRNINSRSEEVLSLAGISKLYALAGEKQRAYESTNEALRLSKTIDVLSGEIGFQFAFSIGTTYELLGERKMALEFYERALSNARAAGNRPSESAMLSIVADIYDGLGEKQKALVLYREALAVARMIGDKRAEAHALSGLGSLYFNRRELHQALEFHHQALVLEREVKDRESEGTTLGLLMLLWSISGNPNLAILCGKEAVNAYQESRGRIKDLDLVTQKEYLKRREHIYRALADLLINTGRLPEAERVLEMLKEEEFLDYVRRDAGVASGLAKRVDLSDAERKAIAEYSKIADELTALGAKRAALDAERLKLPEDAPFPKQAELDEVKRKLLTAETAFTVYLRALADEFGKKHERVEQAKSDLQGDLQRWAIPGAVIISTVVGEDHLHVILTTPSTQKVHTVNKTSGEINTLVAEFRVAVKNPRIDPRPAGQKLYDVLIKPLEADLKGAGAVTLVWSLDGTLRYVPLAALWDGRQYIAERFANVVITLASRTKIGETPTDRRHWRALGLGVSTAHEGFAALAAVPEELRGVIREQGTAETGVLEGRRLLDPAFTQEALARAQGRYPVMHIASHFSFVPGSESNSFLLLGDGSRLTLDKIRGERTMFAGVQLLTLSACDTATGTAEASGKEVESFGKLAQDGGALGVLATLWQVADLSTRDLMIAFYRIYSQTPGLTKAEALQRAQLSLLNGETTVSTNNTQRAKLVAETGNDAGQVRFKFDLQKPYAHPYYWAPFILIGNWR